MSRAAAFQLLTLFQRRVNQHGGRKVSSAGYSEHLNECFNRLSDRTGDNRVTTSDFSELRHWARQLATGHSQYFDATDGSPQLVTLLRELDWLILDSVVGVRTLEGNFSNFENLPTSLQSDEIFASSVSEVIMRQPVAEFKSMWTRRVTERIPLQYICKTAHWRDLKLFVNESVLIPRPETELLIEFVREVLRCETPVKSELCASTPRIPAGPWVDMGTGSGAIAIALAREIRSLRPDQDCKVYAVDVSTEAAQVAQHNVNLHGLDEAVTVINGCWFEPFKPTFQCAAIISNPPYIPTIMLSALQPEVRLHEPRLALDGGVKDGSEKTIIVCDGAARHLLPGGFLALEMHGLEQAKQVASYLAMSGKFTDIQIRADYCSVSRFITARKL